MSKGTVEEAEERTQISIRLTPELRTAIRTRSEEAGLSMNRTILQLLRSGLEAERSKKQRLEEMLQRYRDCTDAQEAKRLSDELGAMIFGR